MSFQSFLSAVSCLADTRRKSSYCLYLDSSKLGCFPLGMKLFSTFFSRSSIVLGPRGNLGPLQVRLILNVCFCTLFSVSGILCQIGAKETKADGASTLRVMSFIIRLGVAKDGPNHWDLRKNLVVSTIKNFNPDLLGTQETHPFQADFLQKGLPGHAYYGVGRMKNPKSGEQCGLMYRKERFELLGSGTFWLSQTPGKPGSKSWDSSLPRIASWARLRDKSDRGREFTFINTHFDHRGRQARLEGAKIIRRHVGELGKNARVIITGDFNAGEGSGPYRALIGSSSEDQASIVDTYRIAHPKRVEGEGTFSAWSGKRSGNRIDWVLHTPHFLTLSANIDRYNDSGRYPSDHYPVTAILKAR